MVVARGIVPGGRVRQGFALHEVRRTTRVFHHFVDLEDVTHRLIPLLALFEGAQVGELVQVLVDQGFQPEENLNPFGDGCTGPAGEGLGGRLDRPIDFLRGTERRMRDERARRWVVAWLVLAGLGFQPFASRVILQLDWPLSAYRIWLHLAVFGDIRRIE